MSDRRKDGGVDAPLNLGGFFGADSEESDEDRTGGFQEVYEVQELELCGYKFHIRQFSWHRANANKVWPGTFNLAEYIDEHIEEYRRGRIIELGAATGALSMFMSGNPRCLDVVTSDIDDGGEVENNIRYNFELNGLPLVEHISHTWGTGWPAESCAKRFKFIFASDILLYVSAYRDLVQTIVLLFDNGVEEFLMSWNRRIAESALFFDYMADAGFRVVHHETSVLRRAPLFRSEGGVSDESSF